MNIFEQIHCEWWQALLLLIALRMYPVFMAIAAILVARCVKPDLAKIALPLILAPKGIATKVDAEPKSASSSTNLIEPDRR